MVVLPSSGETWKLGFLSGGWDSRTLPSWGEHHCNEGRRVSLLSKATASAFC